MSKTQAGRLLILTIEREQRAGIGEPDITSCCRGCFVAILLAAALFTAGCIQAPRETAGTGQSADPTEEETSADVTSPELQAKLLGMWDADQAVRGLVMEPGRDEEKVGEAMRAVDAKHLPRIKEIIERYGWPTKGMVGEDGAHAILGLVVHADSDVAFQERCLELMEAAERDEVYLAGIAFLTDRVRVHQGRPQVYGTQLDFRDHDVVPKPIEDEANVDERRAALGLPPLVEHIEYWKQALEAQNEPNPPNEAASSESDSGE